MDEQATGSEAAKVAPEQTGDRHIHRLKEVGLFEWSPVLVAVNPAAVITGVEGASTAGGTETIDPNEHCALTAATTAVQAPCGGSRERKVGRVPSAANVTLVIGVPSALREAIDALEQLLAAAEPATGRPARWKAVDLRLAQTTYAVLLARARAAGWAGPPRTGYRPGQNPPAGAGQRMSLAISA